MKEDTGTLILATRNQATFFIAPGIYLIFHMNRPADMCYKWFAWNK